MDRNVAERAIKTKEMPRAEQWVSKLTWFMSKDTNCNIPNIWRWACRNQPHGAYLQFQHIENHWVLITHAGADTTAMVKVFNSLAANPTNTCVNMLVQCFACVEKPLKVQIMNTQWQWMSMIVAFVSPVLLLPCCMATIPALTGICSLHRWYECPAWPQCHPFTSSTVCRGQLANNFTIAGFLCKQSLISENRPCKSLLYWAGLV